ncbi:MAG TPA: hypothetical protein VG650_11690 [Mycobacteriales bacterium]|nr:hypothetical protein [Mycobacteriales bacterium]
MTSPSPEGLAERLTASGVDPSVIPHAMRYFVSASTGDAPPEAIRERLAAACGGSAIDAAVDLLARDPDALEAASLAILSSGWEDPATRDLAAGAIDAAGVKLPVVEVGLICLMGVYGMWILATGGRRTEHKVTRHDADGSWSVETITTWHGVAEPLSAIVQILTAGTTGGIDPAATPGTQDGSTP